MDKQSKSSVKLSKANILISIVNNYASKLKSINLRRKSHTPHRRLISLKETQMTFKISDESHQSDSESEGNLEYYYILNRL